MNEMDLRLKIEGLEKAIKEHNDFSATYQNDLKQAQKQLEDYNKPELKPAMMDEIYEAIEKAVNDFDFEDADNYDFEFEMEYDGRVSVGSTNFQNEHDLVQAIVDKVCNLFKEADCPEELDTTEVDNHKPV
tara:strand:+ start:90 stop:482 length:393 start_codon:yes stop_codon:yes gene_type:complete